MPRPACTRIPVVGGGASPRDSAFATMARASGCVAPSSSDLAICSKSLSVNPDCVREMMALPLASVTSDRMKAEAAVVGPPAVTVDRAEVMWSRKDTAGLRFVDLSPAARATIDTLTSRP